MNRVQHRVAAPFQPFVRLNRVSTINENRAAEQNRSAERVAIVLPQMANAENEDAASAGQPSARQVRASRRNRSRQ